MFFLAVGILMTSVGHASSVSKLSVASFLPIEDHQNITIQKAFARIEKLTNGEVSFTYYPSQTLVSAAEAFEGTVKGQCDIFNGALPVYTPGRFPLSLVAELPPNIPKAEISSVLYWDFYKQHKLIQDEWKEVKVLATQVQVTHDIHTVKKPIYTMEDLKGLRIRCTSMGKPMVEAWGGIPVAMPMSEAYVALQKGIVDGIQTNWGQLKSNKLADVVKFHTRVGAYAAIFYIIMNWDAYNTLPQDTKTIFDALGDTLPKEFGQSWDKDEAQGIEWTMAQGGHTMITLTPKDRAEWVEKAKNASIDNWLNGLEKKGLKAAGKLLYDDKLKAVEAYVQ